MLHIALYQPEIPPNTGNIIRLCANTGSQLHLIHPLGFDMEVKALRRAGLDYHEWAEVKQYTDFAAFIAETEFSRIFALTTKAKKYTHEVSFSDGDCLLFGPETRGLPDDVLNMPSIQNIRIPMKPGSRSLNLSNTAAIILYQALADLNYEGLS
ncbi:tRNA (cytidine(34)-2'-O)-methyltransferase [Marinicella sp. S1101]|uniref:tRNA (cytidine(34)-2'-O)-methyltransferase n=1 Tax=Marinicella marina TaxID=2996016 RepID=UPI002260E06C|nr:tRNA (cytidine(34)-2'-O)-methyltransferase [Marinicella marina]MCX7554099.1 tRNA (cytidine(34)-2'-O)-methyltransferase [Marinicella marina]MDJ1141208.1 tRNA (cytidine(34)-2'-O)-methyltransferase [Marinicella marina]